MTFQPPCQPLRQAVPWLLSSGGTQPFDRGCLVLSGAVGPDWFNTQHQLLCVRLRDCVSDTADTKGFTHRNRVILCTRYQYGRLRVSQVSFRLGSAG